jgi:predicted acyl esterase
MTTNRLSVLTIRRRHSIPPSIVAGLSLALGLAGACLRLAQAAPADLPSDIPTKFVPLEAAFDFVKREAMIPMRDGIKLHTVILVPKGALGSPMLLTRTPYGASKSAAQTDSTHLTAVLPAGDDVVSVSGYIRVIQDVRGKYGSQGSWNHGGSNRDGSFLGALKFDGDT